MSSARAPCPRVPVPARPRTFADGCYFDGQIHMEGGEERVRFQEKRRNR